FFAYLTLEWAGVGTMAAFFVVASLVTNQFVDGAALASQIGVGATVLFFVLVSIARLAAPQYDVSLKRRRYLVIYWLFLLSALFWSGFEQAGSSLNLFARDLTARDFGPFALSQTSALMGALVLIGLPAAYIGYRMFRRENLW
ncbi:MFS transporter, partial [Halorubrum sp. GN11_10-6_MGM]